MDHNEDEEWGGVHHEGQDRGNPGEKPSKPTGEEIRAIKDASDLFRSNTFKLQVRFL